MANENFNETNILNRFNSPPQGRFLSQENIGKDSFKKIAKLSAREIKYE